MAQNLSCKRACTVFKKMTGLVCLYKPPDVSVQFLIYSFGGKVCSELNSLKGQRPKNYLDIEKTESGDLSVDIRQSYYDNVLAIGPKYNENNMFFKLSPIGKRSSGVCILGINTGIKHLNNWVKSNPLKVFHIKGKLGEATQYLYKDDKVVAKAKYNRISKATLDKVLSSFESAHRRKIFLDLNIDIQSQEAYELAVNGLLRLPPGSIPCIYSMKCIDFKSPHFTIEMSWINDNEKYLLSLIHDFGLQLKTFAHCTGIRCIRYGPFTPKNALIVSQFSLSNILENMQQCKELTKKYKTPTYPIYLRSRLNNVANEQMENVTEM